MKHFSHLNTATKILDGYKGTQPFGIFIKDFFKSEKKYGSRDRKQISHLCYCYFRLGKALATLATPERIIAGLFFCSTAPNEVLQELRPAWNEFAGLSPGEKIVASGIAFLPADIFPYYDELSEGIDQHALAVSHLHQPDLFIRLRPGKEANVKNKLQQAKIDYDIISPASLALPNGSKIEDIVALNREAVVQDLNSQRVGELLEIIKNDTTFRSQPGLATWDCCAASGGKSIMAKDILPGIQLAVSDIRESILANLRHRFEAAGIKNYRSFVADLSLPGFKLTGQQFDLVIADLPCTGSGTWGRTPEQLYYFEDARIETYAALQKKILHNVMPAIKPGGYLLYITCSVFKKENEEALQFIQQDASFQLKKMEILPGYDKKADTLFAALLQRSL